MPQLEIQPYGKHVVLLGSTGSGKSEMAQELLSYTGSYIAFDTQDSLDRIDGQVVTDPRQARFWLKWGSKRIKYKPAPEWQTKEGFDYVLKAFLDSSSKKRPHPRRLYIDEIFHLGYGLSFPGWLPRGMTTARQRKLSFWIATQRPRMIPVPVLSEAAKIYVFYLSRWEDIKYISGFSRSDPRELARALQNQQDDYSFIEIDARKGTWTKFPKIKLSN